MDSSQKTNILVVGASGHLGALVAKHALKNPKLAVNILIRDLDKAKDLVGEVESSGGKVIQGDLNKPETLKDATKDIHTIISCINAEKEEGYHAQMNILNDAVKNGVKRLFTSHYGISYENATRENLLINTKLKTIDKVSETDVKPVVISCGLITEFFFMMSKQGLKYYGDINQKLDLTSYDDLARFIVAVAADPEKSGKLNLVGQELSTKEIVDTYNRVRGTNVQAANAGTVEDIQRQTEELKKQGNNLQAAFTDLFALVYSGKGKINKLDNKDFPQVKPVPLEDLLREKTDITIA